MVLIPIQRTSDPLVQRDRRFPTQGFLRFAAIQTEAGVERGSIQVVFNAQVLPGLLNDLVHQVLYFNDAAAAHVEELKRTVLLPEYFYFYLTL